MDNGWIKLHRKLIENPIIKKSAYLALWIILLLKANHKDNKMIWNNNIIVVKEGSMITGRKQLSLETGISESTIEDILNFLERQHQIQQQKTTKYRLITILNWKHYQKPDSKSNNKATTKQQQADTNKNVNNDKNEKKEDIAETSSADITILIKSFELINPACKKMYGNITQRKACQFLIDTYGLERVSIVVEKTLPRTNKIQFCPTITTPLQLQDKWSALEASIIKIKAEKPKRYIA